MDSDSDDDLIPSIQDLTSLFNSVQRQARQPTLNANLKGSLQTSTTSAPKNDISKTKKKGSKSKNDTKKSTLLPGSPEVVNVIENPKAVKYSNDTEDLLAQADLLKVPTGITASDSKTTAKKSSKRLAKKVSDSLADFEECSTSRSSGTRTTRNSGKRASKGKKKKPVVEVFDLSDDDDDRKTPILDLNASIESDIFELTPGPPVVEEITIRVRWILEEWKIKHPSGTKMSKVRMDITQKISSEEKRIRADDLLLINEDDNEEVSDNVLIDDIPFGSVIQVIHTNNPSESAKESKKLDPNFIEVKVQGCGGYRERLTVTLRRTTHIQQLIDDYVEKFKLTGKRFKLVFDGDNTDLTETPESLDLEGGEMFDIVEIC